MDQREYIAHVRDFEPRTQSVEEHLLGTSRYARQFAGAVGFEEEGELSGLLHDLGKYGADFQDYIKANSGLFDQDNDLTDFSGKKGRIDHSTAGAQYLRSKILEMDKKPSGAALLSEVITLAIAGHHGGLMDAISAEGKDLYAERLSKDFAKTHLDEVREHISPIVESRVRELLGGDIFQKMADFRRERELLHARLSEEAADDKNKEASVAFDLGCLERFLFSCLVDADRCDTIDFCVNGAAEARQNRDCFFWETLSSRLEAVLSSFSLNSDVNKIRAEISESCRAAAHRGRGIYTLTVPTGGGKTLASLRFALELARLSKNDSHPIERIIYVIPYTTIIDQNAASVRKILEPSEEKGRVVLECHSNLLPENENWISSLLSENWDAPVIFTTSVQFLDALFSGGMKSSRRLHQLANSIVIFDEIQTLPVKAVHLFCSAINLYVQRFGMTAVLCTATQPLLNSGVSQTLGALDYDGTNEIMPDAGALFENLRRVEIYDARKGGGYSIADMADMAIEKQKKYGSALTIVNTTDVSRRLYQEIKSRSEAPACIHLSAMMCPAHRVEELNKIKERLRTKSPVICVSTQVMEAGVDVDFACGIRSLSGFDSMVQAAGRCNREGRGPVAPLYIVNPSDENLKRLPEIKAARDAADEVLKDRAENGCSIFCLENISGYFARYFYKRSSEMCYEVLCGRGDNLLNMYSQNIFAQHEYMRAAGKRYPRKLPQAFKTAGELFKLIDAPTKGLIVPHGEGADLITRLGQECCPAEMKKLLKRAQLFSVNIYPYMFEKLMNDRAIYQIKLCGGDDSVYALLPEFYSTEFGVSGKQDGKFGLEAN